MIEGYAWVKWTLLTIGVMGLWWCWLRVVTRGFDRQREQDDE